MNYKNNKDGTITPIVEKPKPDDFLDGGFDYNYIITKEAYEASQSTRIPLTFKTEKEVLEKGVDFHLRLRCMDRYADAADLVCCHRLENENCTQCETVAVPIEPVAENFYCKEYDKNGYTCEDGQCETCKKVENSDTVPPVAVPVEGEDEIKRNYVLDQLKGLDEIEQERFKGFAEADAEIYISGYKAALSSKIEPIQPTTIRKELLQWIRKENWQPDGQGWKTRVGIYPVHQRSDDTLLEVFELYKRDEK